MFDNCNFKYFIFILGTSSSQERAEDGEEDAWPIWCRIVNEWESYFKKRNAYVRVSFIIYIFLLSLKSLLEIPSKGRMSS